MRKILIIFGCLLWVGFFLASNPADLLAASPHENDLLRAAGRQAWRQAPLPGTDFSVAQLPKSPTFKSDKPKATPAETPPPPEIEKPLDQPAPAKAPKTSGSIVNVRTYGLTRSALEKAIAAIGKEGGCLYFSSGHWDIDADLTIPDRAAVKFDRGALLSVATQKGTGRLSHADESCAGTISVENGSTQVTGAGTVFSKLRSGQFITCAGQRREIRHIADNFHLEVWTPFQTAISGKEFSKSSYIIKGSGAKFNTELEVGDFLYLGKEKHIVTSITGPDALTVAETPKNTFSEQPFTRSARVKILGSLEAGLYQIFSGQGVVKFAPGAVASVHPEWWGAKGNGESALATANSNAIEKALHSMMGWQKAQVAFANGVYQINRPIVLLFGNYLIGQGKGWGGTRIQLVAHSNCHMVQDSLRVKVMSGGLRGIAFVQTPQDGAYNLVHFVHNTQFYTIERCTFTSYTKHPGGYAIYLGPSYSATIKDNFIAGFNGIFAYGFDSFIVNNEIAPAGDYGIYLVGDGDVVQGNILYGDSGCKTGIFSKVGVTSIIGNRIGPFDYGIRIHINGGLISGNAIIDNRQHGIYSNHGVRDAQITGNKILNNKGYGLYFQGGCANSLIKNNTVTGNNGGAGNPQIKLDIPVSPQQSFDEPLVEDNAGVDLQCDYPILAPGSTPNIRISKRWKTGNTKASTITDFLGGCRGKEIILVFGDSQTTLKFSEPSRLKGHGGVDWTPSPGDHLRAVKGDNGFWYCECFDSTSKK
jgi:parallel beta-helix repeat protein